MTTTATKAPSPPTSPLRPSRRRRYVLVVAGLVAVAVAIALTVWALLAGSDNSAPSAPRPAVDPYVQFCDNNSDLCVAPSPAAPALSPDTAYRQFCDNNSDLCAATRP
jgi:hypothetical protein